MPVSISQYVLKVASRCDLACNHCYVYEHADQSWRAKPRFLSQAIARQAARRISEHAEAHGLSPVHVVLHGGEPLLLGRDRLRGILSALRSSIDPVHELDLRIHTNGVRLDEELCELFAHYGVQVGVSLDGDRAANDLHRVFANGHSSHPQVRQALSLLRRPEYRHLYAGILCTVDLRNDPVAVYEALRAEAPPRIDLLLPHATWEQPPPRPPDAGTPYADWLGRIHARWLADGRPLPIRFFDSLLDAWQGRPSGSESVGLDPVDLLVIETDGSWEQADSLKTAFAGAPETGLDIFSHSAGDAAAFGGVLRRQGGLAALCRTCRECPVVRACGGGLYAHRFSRDNGFDNPSVYCDDLKKLVPMVIARAPGVAAMSRPVTSGPEDGTLDSMDRHALPAGGFDRLSAGPGDTATLAALAESNWSITRALVAAVGPGPGDDRGELSRAAAEGWSLLVQLDDEHPQAVREVLTYPYVRMWAARCLKPPPGADTGLDRAHLAAVAAAAALRAGVEVEMLLPVREGHVHLPGVGALATDAATDDTSAVRISAAGLALHEGPGGWQPVRRFTGAGMSFTVDDIDPFRDGQAWAPAGRLSASAWQAWQQGLAAAGQQLAAELPAYASVIAAGLRSVVPMRPAAAGRSASGTAKHGFGAVALALPDSTDMLCELLVHEMQHVKLTALCDLMDLFDPAGSTLHRVPWRPDPRPVEGVLNGTYAYLAVGDLWRSRSRAGAGSQAHSSFLECRSQVEYGIGVLQNVTYLTPAGVRFVQGMDSAVKGWADDG
jgi:uncharacterized protein